MPIPQPGLLHVAGVACPLDGYQLAASDSLLERERALVGVVEAARDDERRRFDARVQPIWIGLVERAEHLDDGVRVRPLIPFGEQAGEVAAHLRVAERRAVVLERVFVAEADALLLVLRDARLGELLTTLAITSS